MNSNSTRRDFIGIGSTAIVAGAAGAFSFLRPTSAQTASAPPQQPAAPPNTPPADPPSSEIKYERPAALKSEDVQAFVGAAHRDLEKVREMLKAEPALVNAAWDWGAGDWETALGAAGHVGQPEIAELLLSRGARLELHAAAMLGWLDFIKSAVAANPGAPNILGPHAIPMHRHALAGGDAATAVVGYLESINAVRDVLLPDEDRPKYVGRYQTQGGVLTVYNANRRLLLQPPGRRAWYLLHQGEGLFLPADNTKVKLTFDMNADGTLAKAMNIDEGDDQAVAVRVE